jgi:hypothetical protein
VAQRNLLPTECVGVGREERNANCFQQSLATGCLAHPQKGCSFGTLLCPNDAQYLFR